MCLNFRFTEKMFYYYFKISYCVIKVNTLADLKPDKELKRNEIGCEN